MKLSEIKGERCLDVIADIIEPIALIAEDKEASEIFKRKKVPDGMDAKKFLIGRIRKSVPRLLKSHKAELIQILAIIEGVSPNKYSENLTLAKLMSDCVELLTDDAFASLFT